MILSTAYTWPPGDNNFWEMTLHTTVKNKIVLVTFPEFWISTQYDTNYKIQQYRGPVDILREYQ